LGDFFSQTHLVTLKASATGSVSETNQNVAKIEPLYTYNNVCIKFIEHLKKKASKVCAWFDKFVPFF
jgi:hypothetical protein